MSNLIQYLIRAKCPYCYEITGFVEERATPVSLTTDVHLPADFCPSCGERVWEEWDIQEEAQITYNRGTTA